MAPTASSPQFAKTDDTPLAAKALKRRFGAYLSAFRDVAPDWCVEKNEWLRRVRC